MLTVHQIINAPVSSNCFVVFNKDISTDCIIVDPGSSNNENLLQFVKDNKLYPRYIILTHEHFDHCWGVNDLVGRFDVPIICSSLCAEWIKNDKKNCSVFYDYNERFVINSKTVSVESLNNELLFAGMCFHFFSTPGHTDACISFYVGKWLFAGDSLIKGLRTVIKLPTGSLQKLKETVKKYIELNGNDFIVCAGHGESFLLDQYDIASAL